MQTTGSASPSTTDSSAPQEHPRGLYVLFGAEAWERFSYYGMRALLVLYMTRHLHFDRPHALAVYALYTGLVYLTPLLGGALADSVLGRRKAVLIGGTLFNSLTLRMQPPAIITREQMDTVLERLEATLSDVRRLAEHGELIAH